MNRRDFIKIIGGLIVLAFAGRLSNLAFSHGKIRVVETKDGYRIIYPDGRFLDVNETGLLAMDGIHSGKSIDEISREIATLTGQSYEKVLYDVRNFVDNLKVLNLV